MKRAPILLVTVALGVPVPSQDAEARARADRLIVQLGDAATREAAEIALVELGGAAVGPISSWLEQADTAAEQERTLAVLEVIGLIGRDAAELFDPVFELVGTGPVAIRMAAVRTRADLAPYGKGESWQQSFHKLHSIEGVDRAAWFVEHMRHSGREQYSPDVDLEALITELGNNRIFVREVVAEELGRRGSDALAALDALRDALLARERKPAGWDGIRRNGIVYPIDDGFALRAAEAMVAIAPNDPRCAVAYGRIAADHPWQAARRDALLSLSALGPDAAPAIPELVEAAHEGPDSVSREALKVLGMVGPEASRAADVIGDLARDPSRPGVAEQAQRLERQLRAMMSEAIELELAERRLARESRAELERLVEQMAEPTTRERAEAALRAAGADGAAAVARAVTRDPEQTDRLCALLGSMKEEAAAAVPELLAHLRDLGGDAPAALVAALVDIGVHLGADERAELGRAVVQYRRRGWSAPNASTFSGGGTTELQLRQQARLLLGSEPAWSALVAALEDQNPYMRLASAVAIRERGVPEAEGPAVVAALAAAMRADHPGEFKVEMAPRQYQKQTAELDDEIIAAATRAIDELRGHASPAVAELAARAWAERRKK